MTNAEKIGSLGEDFICKLLCGRLSDDVFDTEKDIILSDGTTVEVKTQVRSRKTNSFTIEDKPSQMRKSQSVDKLLFVEYGTYGHIRVYECFDRDYTIHRQYDGRSMAHFPINKMKKIYDKQNPLCEEMIKLTHSELRWLNDSYLY